MNRRIIRVAPWQAGKLSAIIYFVLGVLFAVPFAVISFLAQSASDQQAHMSIGFAIALPFVYGLAGLVLAPLGCAIYNLAAKLVGGLSLTIVDDARA
jgi:hypothetical protein